MNENPGAAGYEGSEREKNQLVRERGREGELLRRKVERGEEREWS